MIRNSLLTGAIAVALFVHTANAQDASPKLTCDNVVEMLTDRGLQSRPARMDGELLSSYSEDQLDNLISAFHSCENQATAFAKTDPQRYRSISSKLSRAALTVKNLKRIYQSDLAATARNERSAAASTVQVEANRLTALAYEARNVTHPQISRDTAAAELKEAIAADSQTPEGKAAIALATQTNPQLFNGSKSAAQLWMEGNEKKSKEMEEARQAKGNEVAEAALPEAQRTPENIQKVKAIFQEMSGGCVPRPGAPPLWVIILVPQESRMTLMMNNRETPVGVLSVNLDARAVTLVDAQSNQMTFTLGVASNGAKTLTMKTNELLSSSKTCLIAKI